MSLPITIPYTFATATSTIPLSNLDSDFTTVKDAINGINNGTNVLATPILGNATASSLTVTNQIASTGTSGVGYGTGAGGIVTQSSNKGNDVTLDKICGQIITSNSSLAAAAEITFRVKNSTIDANDVVIINQQSSTGFGSYYVGAGRIDAGEFYVVISNLSTGSLSQALTLNFAVIKSVTA
jgi:hypothetical protein